ncbi:MAG: glucose-6-phosphate isomerase [Bdellovibrionaceae bacterium]|nr:glucose-6-phosphate isomerase [Pseudobdellovibrionaceae bacterium]
MWTLQNERQQMTEKDSLVASQSLKTLLERKDIGFFNTTARKSELAQIQSLADSKKEKYKQIAILGIGGSALGTLALFEAVAPTWIDDKKILFFDNVDSTAFYRKLRAIKNPLETLWVIISKSGSTVETLTQADCIDAYLKQSWNSNIAANSVVITEPKSSDLYDWAIKNKVDVLPVPLDVGGRFSVLTAVGLFPAAFAGMSLEKLLTGAEKALEQSDTCLALLTEYIRATRQQAQAAYFFSYCDDLKSFGAWLEQLWAESLGKKENLKGEVAPLAPIPISCRGATDQHSVLQQVAHGRQQKIVTFFRVGSAESHQHTLHYSQFKATETLLEKSIGALLRAEAIATEQALQEEKVQTVSLFSENLDEQSLGCLFMTYELLVASLGIALGINPFDQPGVERGKVLARSILNHK